MQIENLSLVLFQTWIFLLSGIGLYLESAHHLIAVMLLHLAALTGGTCLYLVGILEELANDAGEGRALSSCRPGYTNANAIR